MIIIITKHKPKQITQSTTIRKAMEFTAANPPASYFNAAISILNGTYSRTTQYSKTERYFIQSFICSIAHALKCDKLTPAHLRVGAQIGTSNSIPDSDKITLTNCNADHIPTAYGVCYLYEHLIKQDRNLLDSIPLAELCYGYSRDVCKLLPIFMTAVRTVGTFPMFCNLSVQDKIRKLEHISLCFFLYGNSWKQHLCF